ncbi:hypothetical protein INQ51_16230 [Maribellus sp. CM-23]|uniref:V-type ATP synthase subunit I n=1 Tax=Maribellus sp. CM-23 TaxID=2781026 RepID=UPI001F255ED3|nr:hypothetical protein [Maribellus sp. CM-23]MCE4565868.1 hypothetical protein [Maribellus sp. CM-23]
MIVPMLKYTFAVQGKEYAAFLDNLQEWGIVHVIEKEAGETGTREQEEVDKEIHRLEKTLKILDRFRDEEMTASATSNLSSEEAVTRTDERLKKRDAAKVALEQAKATLAQAGEWGIYSSDLLQKLEQEGISIHFYSIPKKKFKKEWLEKYAVSLVADTGHQVKFACINHDEVTFEGATAEKLPERDLSVLENDVAKYEAEVQKQETALSILAHENTDKLQEQLSGFVNRHTWLDVWNNKTLSVGEGIVRILEGWVPKDRSEQLNKYLEEHGILYLVSKKSAEEQPPIELKNSRFGKLFEPISKLFALPAYQELDLTIYFAPFFMLFFGFCLGDAGYGLVLLLGSTIYGKFASDSVKPFLPLGQLFGASTLVMGLIFGTFFGIELAKVPQLEQVKSLFLDSSQVFSLSLVIGAVQIIFGIVLRIVNQLRQEHPQLAIGTIGWLLLFATAGLFEFVWKDAEKSTLMEIAPSVLYGLSLVMIVFFSGTGPVFMRAMGGIWEIYNTVTSIFGDLLSYIRLFALGIASSILGLVINQMAISFGSAPYIGPVIFVLIIVIGHTANLAISSLGAFVHPMRLTFVEFYKNAGFQGTGKPYQPFSKRVNNN